MQVKKNLTNIVLAGCLALGGASCKLFKSNENPTAKNNSSAQTQSHQSQYRSISGKIVSIDEDSFAIGSWYKGANFEFEHFRIASDDGKLYKLIFPGPSNYQVGDSVKLAYTPQSKVSYQDLIKEGAPFDSEIYLLQVGFFETDGIIVR